MMTRFIAGAGLALVGLASPSNAAGLPNGASSLNETYDAWRVVCQSVRKGETERVSCALSQALTKKGTRSVVFRVRLVPGKGGGSTGQMILPLGVSLKEGVTLQIDEGAETAPNAYSTCVRAGCIVPIDWSDKTIAGLKSGGTLKVNATGVDGQKYRFEVNLKGVSAAFDRAAGLIVN